MDQDHITSGKDVYKRQTLSCTMEIDKNGNVKSSEIYKAVINVTERMTSVSYTHLRNDI